MKADEHMLLTNNFTLMDLYKCMYIHMYTFFELVVRINQMYVTGIFTPLNLFLLIYIESKNILAE